MRTGSVPREPRAAGSAGKEEPGPSKSWGTFQDGKENWGWSEGVAAGGWVEGERD